LAVATWTFAVTAFPSKSETLDEFSLGRQKRFLIAASLHLPYSQVPDACDRVPSEEVSKCPGPPPE